MSEPIVGRARIAVQVESRVGQPRPLAPGDVIHGFAGGAFGRDHYNCVRIEAVGPDWIVARDPDDPERWPSFAVGREELELCQKARDKGHRLAMQGSGGTGDEPCVAAAAPPLTTYGRLS